MDAGQDGAYPVVQRPDAVGGHEYTGLAGVGLGIDGGLGVQHQQLRRLGLEGLLEVVVGGPVGELGAAQIISGNAVILPQNAGVDAGLGGAGAHDQHIHGVIFLLIKIGHAADAVIIFGHKNKLRIAKHQAENQQKAQAAQPEQRDLPEVCHIIPPHICDVQKR